MQGKIAGHDITYAGGYFWRKLDTVIRLHGLFLHAYDQCCGYGAYWVGADQR